MVEIMGKAPTTSGGGETHLTRLACYHHRTVGCKHYRNTPVDSDLVVTTDNFSATTATAEEGDEQLVPMDQTIFLVILKAQKLVLSSG